MATRIQLPDGTILEAPDGADPSAVAKAYLAKQQQQPKPSMGQRIGREAGLGVRSTLEGGMDLLSPFADPIGQGLNKVLPGNPFPASHSENFSQLLTNVGLPKPESTSEKVYNTAGRIVTGMAGGGAIEKTAATGLGYGAARAAPRAAPTASRLKELSRQAYQQAEDAGVVINPESFAKQVGTIIGTTAKEGIDPTLHPMATAALKRLTGAVEAGEPIPLQQLETLRKVASGAAGSLSKDERRIARIIVDALDDYALGLKETDIVAGTAANAGAQLRNARSLWSRASKSEAVESLIERARNRSSQFSGSGYENALRTEFRNLIQNPKRLRLFSPAEQNALRTVARGGPVENVLRYFGKLAPTGTVSGAISAGAGAAVGGVPGAIALPLLGGAARQGATALTSRNARLAGELMRRGAPAAPTPISQMLAPGVAPALGGTPSLYDFLMRREQR